MLAMEGTRPRRARVLTKFLYEPDDPSQLFLLEFSKFLFNGGLELDLIGHDL